MNYKILLPGGYSVASLDDDNIDVNVIFENGEVYFASMFTLTNIQKLMVKDNISYYWADNMIIIEDLQEKTIIKAVKEIIEDEYLEESFSKIGDIKNVYGDDKTFNNIRGLESELRIVEENDE